MQSIEFEITNDNNDNNYPLPVNRIPQLTNTTNLSNVTIFYMQLDANNGSNENSKQQYKDILLAFVPNNLLTLFNNKQYDILEANHKIFWINEHHMDMLINDIINTTGKFVYPMIFVNFIKQSLNIKTKIKLDDSFLFYLRIWSNQLRDIYQSLPKYQRNKKIFTPSIKLYAYNICCELLYNFKYVNL